MSELVGDLTPLEGGWSGETYAAGDALVVRIYGGRSQARGPDAVDVDAAVLRLVRGLLPVPSVVEVRRPDPATGLPALLVTTRLPGERLDLVLPTADAALRFRLGEAVGEVLRTLRGIPFLRRGELVDGDLAVREVPELLDLRTWVEHHLTGTALTRWSPEEVAGLLSLADHGQDLLDDVDLTCLVHSDLNPKNLLVDPGSGEVTGVVDWEFAHAGLPVTDLGNLLRNDRDPDFVGGVLGRLPGPHDRLVDAARAADLVALVELAARRTDDPVARQAHDRLLAMVRAGDLHATA